MAKVVYIVHTKSLASLIQHLKIKRFYLKKRVQVYFYVIHGEHPRSMRLYWSHKGFHRLDLT